MTNDTKALIGAGAIGVAVIAWLLFGNNSSNSQALPLTNDTTVQPDGYQVHSAAPDLSLASSATNVPADNCGLPTCGCSGGTQTFVVDNQALSDKLNNMYVGFATDYFDNMKSLFPNWLKQYFNNTSKVTGLSNFSSSNIGPHELGNYF